MAVFGLLLVLGSLIVAAMAGPVSKAPTEIVQSSTGRAYKVMIGPNVTALGGSARPLILVLDGDEHFRRAVEIASAMAQAGEIPPVVVAGVSGQSTSAGDPGARLRDFTDRVPESAKPERIRREGIATGQVAAFGSFVAGELLPYIRARAPFDERCAILFGHSLGGLAVLHLAAERPKSFSAFVASSPSVWWGNGSILNRLRRLPPLPASARPELLITVGALEQPPQAVNGAGVDFRMIDNARRAASILQSQPKAVASSFKVIPDRAHSTVAADSLRLALHLSARCKDHAPFLFDQTQARRIPEGE